MQVDDYSDIGRYLRDVRESLKVSVEQAARDLHIRPKYLHDLERGDLSAMPGKAYIRGYVKNYAEYLRLDALAVLAEYEKLFGGNAQQFFIPSTHSHQQLPSRGLIWLGLAGIAVLYGYWYFGIYSHTEAKNTLPETPLLAKEAPAMPDAWDNCLDSGEARCFLELDAGRMLPDMKPPAAMMPSVDWAALSKDDSQ